MSAKYKYKVGDRVYGFLTYYGNDTNSAMPEITFDFPDVGIVKERDPNEGGNVPKYRVDWQVSRFVRWEFESEIAPTPDQFQETSHNRETHPCLFSEPLTFEVNQYKVSKVFDSKGLSRSFDSYFEPDEVKELMRKYFEFGR